MLRYFEIRRTHTGLVLIITTNTFVRVVGKLKNKSNWTVILDEAFNPANRDTFDSKDYDYLVSDLFQIDDKSNHATSKYGQRQKLSSAYKRKYDGITELQHPVLEKFVDAVMNPAMDLHLVSKKNKEGVLVWDGFWFITPYAFKGFKQVIFLSALFSNSILKHIWQHSFGVKWEKHPFWIFDKDTHVMHGNKINIGYFLHPDDNASKDKIFSNIETGKPGAERSKSALTKMLEFAHEYFGDKKYLVSLNIKVTAKLPENSTRIPPGSFGMNSWDMVDNIAALAVTNPKPELLKLLRKLMGNIKDDDIRAIFRQSTIYQNIGRISIRNHKSKVNRSILVASKADADFLLDLFVCSRAIGKVGDLPSIKLLRNPNADKPKVSHSREYKNISDKIYYYRKNGNHKKVSEFEAQLEELKKSYHPH